MGATWVGGVPPVTLDDERTKATHTVTIDIAVETTGSAEIQENGILDLNGNRLVCDERNAANWSFKNDGTLIHSNGTIEFTATLDSRVDFLSVGNPYDIIINTLDRNVAFATDTIIENDLTITRGMFIPEVPGWTLTVTRYVDITNGTLGSAGMGNASFFSLSIGATGIYDATAGVTTILGIAAGGQQIAVIAGGTLTHNGGTFSCGVAGASNNFLAGNSLEDLIVTAGGPWNMSDDFVLTGYLSITNGTVSTTVGDSALTVAGILAIGDGIGVAESAALGCNGSTIQYGADIDLDTDGLLDLMTCDLYATGKGAEWDETCDISGNGAVEIEGEATLHQITITGGARIRGVARTGELWYDGCEVSGLTLTKGIRAPMANPMGAVM